jgi:predicted NACHT family NTPase
MTQLPVPWEGIFEKAWNAASEIWKKTGGAAVQHQTWKRASQIYREKILDWHGTTRILGKPDPIKLDNIFTDVRILEKPQNVRQISAEALQEEFSRGELHKQLKRMDGIEALEQFPRLYILGKPGAGKTTFLKWIALRCADEYLNGIPIFIGLKEMADANRSIMQQILFNFEACQFPNAEPFVKALLKSGGAVALLDGLDEVPGEEGTQDKVIDNIRDFVREYGKNRIVVTCRVAAVSYAFDAFKYVEMADFTEEQIETYVQRYFDPDVQQASACLAELQKPDHKGLRDISGSPLLLSLLCLNYEESGTFPARRVDLYEDALKALLVKWDSSRRIKRDTVELYKQLPVGRKPHLYAALAYENFTDGRYFMSTKMLVQQTESYLRNVPGFDSQELDGELVLRSMEAQHGVIVERAKQVHAFSHLTFQEYYTAKYIVDNQAVGTLDELLNHATDRGWREVFLQTASLLSHANDFFKKFAVKLAQLAEADPLLLEFFTYVDRRTNYYSKVSRLDAANWNFLLTFRRGRRRNFALDRALDRTRALASDLALDLAYAGDLSRGRDRALNLDRARGRALNLTRDNALSRARALNLTRDNALSRDRARDRARALDRALDLALALALDLDRDLSAYLDDEIGIDIIALALCELLWTAKSLPLYVNLAVRYAKEIGLTGLAQELNELQLPQYDDWGTDNPEWILFRRRMTDLARNHLQRRFDWNFSESAGYIVVDYLYASLLYLECLNVAVVTDRESFKDRLLRPPTNAV